MTPVRTREVAVVAWLLAGALVGAGATALGLEGATATATATSPVSARRDPRWAVRLERPGLRNLHRVSPTLYRGAQPTREGLAELRQLGVKTVVSLRAFHGERALVAAAGLGYERISFEVWHPEDEDMRRFLAIATDPARQPVFVHCQRGADRTGMAVAVYRICVEGWSRAEAIDELVHGGYAFEPRFSHLEKYLRTFEVEEVAPGNVRKPAAR